MQYACKLRKHDSHDILYGSQDFKTLININFLFYGERGKSFEPGIIILYKPAVNLNQIGFLEMFYFKTTPVSGKMWMYKLGCYTLHLIKNKKLTSFSRNHTI